MASKKYPLHLKLRQLANRMHSAAREMSLSGGEEMAVNARELRLSAQAVRLWAADIADKDRG